MLFRSYELNTPLQVLMIESSVGQVIGNLPPVNQLLDISANNLILSAFKQSETNPDYWILRCYECQGESAKLTLKSSLEITIDCSVDLLENIKETDNSEQEHRILPWKIASFLIKVTSFLPNLSC